MANELLTAALVDEPLIGSMPEEDKDKLVNAASFSSEYLAQLQNATIYAGLAGDDPNDVVNYTDAINEELYGTPNHETALANNKKASETAKITLTEKLKNFTIFDAISKLPFSPLFGYKKGLVAATKQKLETGKYPVTSFAGLSLRFGELVGALDVTKEQQKKLVEHYEKEFKRERNIKATIFDGVTMLPAYMIEFATGGAAAKALGLPVKGIKGAFAASSVRTLIQPHRVASAFIDQKAKGEAPATAVFKAYGDVYIENLSEAAGEGFMPLVKKMPFGSKLIGAMTRIGKKLHIPESEVIKRISTAGGWNGLVSEWGEERLGTELRAIFDVEDFGTGPDSSIPDRMAAGFLADMTVNNQLSEAGVLAFPFATKMLASKIVGSEPIEIEPPPITEPTEAPITPPSKAVEPTKPKEAAVTAKRVEGGVELPGADRIIAGIERQNIDDAVRATFEELADSGVKPQQVHKEFWSKVFPELSPTVQKQALQELGAVMGETVTPENQQTFIDYMSREFTDVTFDSLERSDRRLLLMEAGLIVEGGKGKIAETVRKSLPTPAKAVPAEKVIGAEKESLLDVGIPRDEVSKTSPAEAKKKLGKKIAPEKTTPPAVAKEFKGKQPELTEESKNAPTILENYWREYDEREFEINVQAMENQEKIAKALGKKTYLPKADVDVKDTSMAMMLYIDLKEHPEGHKFAKKLKGNNKTIYEKSQNLPTNIQKIADKIIEQNRQAGELAVEQGVIKEARENYIAHLWERKPQHESFFAKFRQKTQRAKQRTMEGGIAEGLSKGMKLRVADVTLASQLAQSQVNQANVGKKLLQIGKEWGLLSHQQEAEDWIKVEHPGFTTWRFRGKVELGEIKPKGAGIYVTDEGVVMEKVPVYAEPELGKKLNNVFAPSVLYKFPGVETLTRYNAILKSTLLYTSLFHHQAFLRSYAFGSHGLNPVEAYDKGKQAIMNMEPEVRLLVRNGLTLGRIQDYDPRMLEGEDTIWGKAMALTEPTEKANEWLQNQRRRQERFLFNKLGPYLKIQAALLELRAGMERNKTALESGVMTADDVARAAATLMNNDFGGLHLGRMGRNNSIQHFMRLTLLAPDWTESNVRSMISAFRAGEEGYMHRMFWGRIAVKAMGATVLFNLLMAGFDDEDFVERYKRAWEEGKLRWLDVDITPIYKALGGTTDSRKYFSLIGHFRDPVKFVARPGASLKHKGSVVSRIMFDFASGQDWAGRQFTTIGEVTGLQEDGEMAGRLVKWSRGKAQFLEPSQLPSWFVYEGRQIMPIPIQNIAAFLSGEMEAFDAITKSVGMMTSTTYPKANQSRGRRRSLRR